MGRIYDNKVYGDVTSLQRLGKGPTKQGSGELVPRTSRPVGRPSSGPTYRGVPTQGTPTEAQQESPYAPLYHDFGRAARVAEVAQALAADELVGPWLRSYKRLAAADVEAKGKAVRDSTPFWEG